MAAKLVGKLLGGGKKKAAAAPAETRAASGPIIAQLGLDSPLRRNKGTAEVRPSIRVPRNLQTILSGKLGN